MLEKSQRYSKPEGKNICLIVVTHGFIVQSLAEIFHSFYRNNVYTANDLISDLTECKISPKDINDALQKYEYPGDTTCFYCSITAGKLDIENEKASFDILFQ